MSMSMRRPLPFMLTAAVMVGLLSLCGPAFAMSGAEALKTFNRDSDKTLEKPEVLSAATSVFNQLNPSHLMTHKESQTTGRVTEQEWKRFNPDGDKTLELDEWLNIATERFDAADMNKDGKLTAAELDSPAGQSLILMMVK